MHVVISSNEHDIELDDPHVMLTFSVGEEYTFCCVCDSHRIECWLEERDIWLSPEEIKEAVERCTSS